MPMQHLFTFAALSMCCSAVLTLLPDGSLRKTAMLVTGLLLISMWAEGLTGVWQAPFDLEAPDTVLTAVDYSIQTAGEVQP